MTGLYYLPTFPFERTWPIVQLETMAFMHALLYCTYMYQSYNAHALPRLTAALFTFFFSSSGSILSYFFCRQPDYTAGMYVCRPQRLHKACPGNQVTT